MKRINNIHRRNDRAFLYLFRMDECNVLFCTDMKTKGVKPPIGRWSCGIIHDPQTDPPQTGNPGHEIPKRKLGSPIGPPLWVESFGRSFFLTPSTP